ncbi:MAG: hypothetical protein HT580_04745 [Dechloromonas sp.]|nr:MAG: hypothetical protein HT580_04745 [Dechloromonas sp.]
MFVVMLLRDGFRVLPEQAFFGFEMLLNVEQQIVPVLWNFGSSMSQSLSIGTSSIASSQRPSRTLCWLSRSQLPTL